MIGWIFDRWWTRKNRAELQAIGDQMDWLNRENDRLLERRMVEMCGPDWRAEAERRLQDRLAGKWTST